MNPAPHRLVLLPGLHGTDRLFDPLQRALPYWIESIALSYPLDHLRRYSEVLPYILERVPDGRFSVLGDSYSGPLALMLANAIPERVVAVVLSATFLTNPLPPLLRWARAFAYAPFIRVAPVRLGAALLLTNGFSHSDALDEIVREVRTVSPRVLAARLRETMDGDFRDAAALCAVPILYLRPRSDRIVGAHASRELLASNAMITEQVIDGPHAQLFIEPAEAAVHIDSFLHSVTS